MRVRLATLLRLPPALGEGVCRLTQTFGAQAILDPGLGHRQAVGLGRAPAFGRATAVERDATAGAGHPAGSKCRHGTSLRAVECQGKIVIMAKTNPHMADA